MANERNAPTKNGPSIEQDASTTNDRKAVEELKAKIAKARGRSDMPFDSTLGNPNWDKNAADGHLDVPDDDEDGWPPSQAKANKTSPP